LGYALLCAVFSFTMPPFGVIVGVTLVLMCLVCVFTHAPRVYSLHIFFVCRVKVRALMLRVVTAPVGGRRQLVVETNRIHGASYLAASDIFCM